MSHVAANTATLGKQESAEKQVYKKTNAKVDASVKEKTDFYTLRFRSTGLGTTMMEGEPAGFDVIDDMLVMNIQTTTPTRWKIRSALTYKGVMKVIFQAIRWKVLKFLLLGWWRYKNPRLSKDF